MKFEIDQRHREERAAKESSIRIAKNLLGKLPLSEIADATGLTLAQVQELQTTSS